MVQKARRLGDRPRAGRPLGNPTRGTTHANRMRRVDRWLTGTQASRLRRSPGGLPPLAVDLGYGATAHTAVELFTRLRAVHPGAELVGLEIDPERVAAAAGHAREGLSFAVGGFEVPVDRPPTVLRAFNVLRQYDESDVPGIWALLCAAVDQDGVVVEGTCDELGRRAAWVALTRRGPETLTLSMRFDAFARPSDVADRLPKALIHRNVPGERVHAFLAAADAAWLATAPLSAYGRKQRMVALCAALRAAGWPVRDTPSRWRLGELTVGWECVAPRSGGLALPVPAPAPWEAEPAL